MLAPGWMLMLTVPELEGKPKQQKWTSSICILHSMKCIWINLCSRFVLEYDCAGIEIAWPHLVFTLLLFLSYPLHILCSLFVCFCFFFSFHSLLFSFSLFKRLLCLWSSWLLNVVNGVIMVAMTKKNTTTTTTTSTKPDTHYDVHSITRTDCSNCNKYKLLKRLRRQQQPSRNRSICNKLNRQYNRSHSNNCNRPQRISIGNWMVFSI